RRSPREPSPPSASPSTRPGVRPGRRAGTDPRAGAGGAPGAPAGWPARHRGIIPGCFRQWTRSDEPARPADRPGPCPGRRRRPPGRRAGRPADAHRADRDHVLPDDPAADEEAEGASGDAREAGGGRRGHHQRRHRRRGAVARRELRDRGDRRPGGDPRAEGRDRPRPAQGHAQSGLIPADAARRRLRRRRTPNAHTRPAPPGGHGAGPRGPRPIPQTNPAMLEFPRWKYAVILIVVVLSVLYASPNLFQKDPAVQVTKNRAGAVVDEALAERVRSILGEAGVEGARVALEGDQVLVRLPDAGTQTRAADALRPALGEDYTAALNLVPTTPAWLEALGARPMSLGLDLQGGVHFMMQVDQQAALEKRLDSYADAIRAALREARICYTGAERRADATVAVTLASAGDAARARSELQQALAGLRAPTALGGGPTVEVDGNRITVRLPEAELNRIATEAIEQNRNVISNRINAIGVAEPVLQRQGEDRLVIQLPGLQDTAEAKRLIGATATLEFRAVTGDEAQAAAALAD